MLKKTFWLFLVTVFLLALFLPGYTKLQDLKTKNKELSLKIERLKKENLILENEVTHIQNDPFYQERIVRDKMGVVRKGEIPFKVITEE